MRLKKANAVIALITTFLLLAHCLYQVISYTVLYYNPAVTGVFAGLLSVAFIAHGVISMIIVFKRNDTVKIDYPKQNVRSIIQRDLGMLSALLFFVHAVSFPLLQKAKGTGWYVVIEGVQVLFFTAVFAHVSVSFSRAFVSLGLITDAKKLKTLDICTYIVCAVLWTVTCFVTVITHTKIVGGGQ